MRECTLFGSGPPLAQACWPTTLSGPAFAGGSDERKSSQNSPPSLPARCGARPISCRGNGFSGGSMETVPTWHIPMNDEPGLRSQTLKTKCDRVFVSRILSPDPLPGRFNGHSSHRLAAAPGASAGCDSTRSHIAGAEAPAKPARRPFPLFCLAPREVFRAPNFTIRAVGSYPAISPLPAALRPAGGVFSATLSVDGSFRLRLPRFLRGALPGGVRTFL